MKGEWFNFEKLNLIAIYILHKIFRVSFSKLAIFLPSRNKKQIVGKAQKAKFYLRKITNKFLEEYCFDESDSIEDRFSLIRKELCTFLKEYSLKNEDGEKDMFNNEAKRFSLFRDEIEMLFHPEMNAKSELEIVQSVSLEISNEDYKLLSEISRQRVPILNYRTLTEFLIRKIENK
jgi:hypothetical protein